MSAAIGVRHGCQASATGSAAAATRKTKSLATQNERGKCRSRQGEREEHETSIWQEILSKGIRIGVFKTAGVTCRNGRPERVALGHVTEARMWPCMLASVSEYFRGLLVSKASPSKKSGAKADTKLDLACENATAASFAAVLECLYTGKLVVAKEMLVPVVHLSNKLVLPAVRAACVARLVALVNESNMEQMLARGEELGCTELVEAAKAVIRKCSGRTSPGGEGSKENKTTKCPWTKEEDELVCKLKLVEAHLVRIVVSCVRALFSVLPLFAIRE